MNIFVEYANYYDLLYQDKDYKKEVGYVVSLIKRYGKNNTREIIDIGCGTGNHDYWLARKGYRVVGIDRSFEMIDIAKSRVGENSKIKFYKADATRFNLKHSFDAAISLFHVMSYQISNESLRRSFKNVYLHLKKNGLFIFDFWYGPAVLSEKPKMRVKEIKDRDTIIERIAIPTMYPNKNLVDIQYAIVIKDKKGKVVKRVKEIHSLRYFFLPELHFMLSCVGFKIIANLPWLSFKKELNAKSWSGVLIARK